MRQTRPSQLQLGEVGIADIRINPKSRDDIPALLIGLQALYADAGLRDRLFAILEDQILPGTDHSQGRPGMDLRRLSRMGVIRQGPGRAMTVSTRWRAGPGPSARSSGPNDHGGRHPG